MFDYLQKFNSLPQNLRDKVSSPSAMSIITELENKYRVDLAIVVMKVMIKEILIKNLPNFLVDELSLDSAVAVNLTRELKEKVFILVADHLGLENEKRLLDLDKDADFLIKEAGLVLPSADLITRFKNIITTYLRGVRSKIDTRASLGKPVVNGGLDLNPIEIDKILKVCDSHQFNKLTVSPAVQNSSELPVSRLDKIIAGAEGVSAGHKIAGAGKKEEEYSLEKAISSGEIKTIKKIDSGNNLASPKKQLDLPAPKKQLDLPQPKAKSRLLGSIKKIFLPKPKKALTQLSSPKIPPVKSDISSKSIDFDKTLVMIEKTDSLKVEIPAKPSMPVKDVVSVKSEISAKSGAPVKEVMPPKVEIPAKPSVPAKETMPSKPDVFVKSVMSVSPEKQSVAVKAAENISPIKPIPQGRSFKPLKKSEIVKPVQAVPSVKKEKTEKKSFWSKLFKKKNKTKEGQGNVIKTLGEEQSKIIKKTVVESPIKSTPFVAPQVGSGIKTAIQPKVNPEFTPKTASNVSANSSRLASRPPVPPASLIRPVSHAASTPRPVSPRPAPASSVARPRMDDIKSVPKVMGPIEELQFLDLVNFRRLGKTPEEIVNKILSKIKLLEKDGYDKMVAGVRAWRQSPVNRLYIRSGQEAIAKGISLKEAVEIRQKAGQECLTIEEIQGIVALNGKLVF